MSRASPGSNRVQVMVQPRASRSEVIGRHGDAIRIRLQAPPVDGAANEELVRFIAERVGVPRGRVTIVAGHQARRKLVAIEGVEDAEARLLGGGGAWER